MDDDNDGINADRVLPDEDGAIRRNQVLIFGVVLLGILAICLAVSMPSDLEFNDSELPTSTGSMHPVVNDRPSLPTVDPSGKRNQTNSTSRKKNSRNPEVPVEVKLLRDMAIQRKIQEYDNTNSNNFQENTVDVKKYHNTLSKEELEIVKVSNIVETFVGGEDFEDFLIDMEIHDAVQRLRHQKGYKQRSRTIFDELFKRVEKEFFGEDEEELRLIRRVGEELEKRARVIIHERKKARGQDLTEPEELIANELLKLDYSGSGEMEDEHESDSESTKETILEVGKIEL